VTSQEQVGAVKGLAQLRFSPSLAMENPPFTITGWWFFATPLKNDGVKVSWDDYSIRNMMGKLKRFQTTNQINCS
jgi:hypothetical protein